MPNLIVEVLERFPLYQKAELDKEELIFFPSGLHELGFNCFCKRCDIETTHKLVSELRFRISVEKHPETGYLMDLIDNDGFFEFQEYFKAPCQKCRFEYITLSLRVFSDKSINKPEHKIFALKTGQYPPFNNKLNPDVLKVLSKEGRKLYQKAMNLYGNAYGIGCMVYLRRIVEEEVLLVLKNVITKEQSEVLEEIENQHKGIEKKKVYEFANSLIPETMASLGNNPISKLWDISSTAIHSMTDEESMEKCSDMIALLNFVLLQLQAENQSYKEIKRILK
ncbi:hypothetical protein [Algoriphagus winogradskyi]|uniref:DUF4145 domain-containing protein n=1 Tax=Algoriphagus winogradskyi TaxID=237017 RepID=A0ABY1PBY3_9BACT|nr:hypothetical protein [Algoriphagus winogradskyi]SMP29783.1 hypothetical protein SAMN06265367_106183 [Algoriphagus winogradskyi]